MPATLSVAYCGPHFPLYQETLPRRASGPPFQSPYPSLVLQAQAPPTPSSFL